MIATAGIASVRPPRRPAIDVVGDLGGDVPDGQVDDRERPQTDPGGVRGEAPARGEAEQSLTVGRILADIDGGDRLADLLGDGTVASERERPAGVAGRSS